MLLFLLVTLRYVPARKQNRHTCINPAILNSFQRHVSILYDADDSYAGMSSRSLDTEVQVSMRFLASCQTNAVQNLHQKKKTGCESLDAAHRCLVLTRMVLLGQMTSAGTNTWQ
jgi:hypothetical protein